MLYHSHLELANNIPGRHSMKNNFAKKLKLNIVSDQLLRTSAKI